MGVSPSQTANRKKRVLLSWPRGTPPTPRQRRRERVGWWPRVGVPERGHPRSPHRRRIEVGQLAALGRSGSPDFLHLGLGVGWPKRGVLFPSAEGAMNRHSQIPFCTLVNLSPPLPRRLLLRPDGAVPPRWRLPSPMPRGWEDRERLVPLLEPVRLERPCPHPARGSCRSWQPARVLRDATWPPGQAAGHDRPHHVEEGRPLREVGLGECLAQEPRRAPGGHVPRPARSGSRGGFAHGAARGQRTPPSWPSRYRGSYPKPSYGSARWCWPMRVSATTRS